MKFLGNRPPPLHHRAIVAALAGLDEVDEGFSVPGVSDGHMRQWLARCWTWHGRPPNRIFSRP